MNRKKEFSRRQILGALGAAPLIISQYSPLRMLFESIVRGSVRNVHASESGSEVVNYLSILMAGAPARWNFDLPLRLYLDDPMVIARKHATRFVAGGTTQVEYETTPVGEYQFPWLWQSELPHRGIKVPMKDLADHMLIVRGMDVISNSHNSAQGLQLRPIAARSSLAGLAADFGRAPFPAISVGDGSRSYFSERGKEIISTNGAGNPIHFLLNPVAEASPVSVSDDSLESAIRQAMSVFSAASEDQGIRRGIYQSRSDAVALFRRSYTGLADAYPNLEAKYLAIAQDVMKNSNLAQLDDRPIISDQNDFRYYHLLTYCPPSGEDWRDSFRKLGYGVTSNQRKYGYIAGLIEAFAVAEYLFSEGLSNCVSTITNDFQIGFNRLWNSNNGTVLTNGPHFGGAGKFINDHHFAGEIATMYVLSMHYRILSACLLEFIASMKAKSAANGKTVFHNTLVHLNSDYGRGAGDAESGHAPQACVSSFWSGMVRAPLVVGNIVTPGGASPSPSVGDGGPIPEIGNRPAGMGNYASTVATLLRAPTLAPNDMSLVRIENGAVVPNISGRPKCTRK